MSKEKKVLAYFSQLRIGTGLLVRKVLFFAQTMLQNKSDKWQKTLQYMPQFLALFSVSAAFLFQISAKN